MKRPRRRKSLASAWVLLLALFFGLMFAVATAGS